MANEVVYTSDVRVERIKGPYRRAYLPVDVGPVAFGVHSGIAEHYGTDMTTNEPHAATLDYVVAAATGWLTGTFGGALEARNIPAGEGYLVAEGRGEIESEDNVLVIRRIHVRYKLKLAPEKREAAERAHAIHADYCPVARTIRDCVEVTTSLEMADAG